MAASESMERAASDEQCALRQPTAHSSRLTALMLPTRYVSCSFRLGNDYTVRCAAQLGDSPELRAGNRRNAQTIADFHKTNACLESRISLASRLRIRPSDNISPKERILFTCGSLRISPRRQVVRPSRSVHLFQRRALLR